MKCIIKKKKSQHFSRSDMCLDIACTTQLAVLVNKNGNIEWITATTNNKRNVKLNLRAANICWKYVSPTSLGCFVKILTIGIITILCIILFSYMLHLVFSVLI